MNTEFLLGKLLEKIHLEDWEVDMIDFDVVGCEAGR
jgi:hypothetical protein